MSTDETALRERLAGVLAEAVTAHAEHMETYTLPALRPGFMDGWAHALRLLTRDAGFIGSKAADTLLPVVAQEVAAARAEALRELREEIRRAAHGFPSNTLARAALAFAEDDEQEAYERGRAEVVAKVEAATEGWTTATCQTDGAPCSWRRVAAECAQELRAALGGDR